MFSERLQKRSRVWWGKPNKWQNRESYHHLLHRLKENHTLRSRDDPEVRWHCCDLWQRTLSNKWNAREFVQRHGCRVPELYWRGRRISRLPLDALPEHFVIKPVWGASAERVYAIAGGRDLLHRRTYTPQSLRDDLQRTMGRLARFPTLVEEFVKTEASEYKLPIDYKCYTFGATIGAIQTVHRSSQSGPTRHRFYTPSWKPFEDQMSTSDPPADYVEPPRCLDEMRRVATRLGLAYGTFVRVDLYATDKGCVFGEFSTTPNDGEEFTPYADEYFEELWRTTFPDRT